MTKFTQAYYDPVISAFLSCLYRAEQFSKSSDKIAHKKTNLTNVDVCFSVCATAKAEVADIARVAAESTAAIPNRA